MVRPNTTPAVAPSQHIDCGFHRNDELCQTQSQRTITGYLSTITRQLIIVCLLLVSNATFAAVSAIIDRNQVYTGDAFTLTIRSSGRGENTPDLSVLDADFIVLATGKSTQVSINNGKRTDSSSWTVNLKAKHKGQFTIPSIAVGQEKTSPLVLTVVDIPPEITAKMAQHFFIEVEVDPGAEVYVQQQIPLTVKFYHDGSIVRGTLSQPSADNAVIETLGRETNYTASKNGKNFQVVERHYTVSAERSGELTINPVQFDGRMRTGQANNRRSTNNPYDRLLNNNPFSNDPFFNRQPTQPVHTESQAVVIKILPRSGSDAGSGWLPAEELVLQDSWAKTPPKLLSGEPVTRTITVRTKGLGASQLPEIDIQKPANTRMYIDKPESRTQTDGKTLYAISQINITYIPQQSGPLLIPEVRLDWWNTKSSKKQTATLAQHKLMVSAGSGFNTTNTNQSPSDPETPSNAVDNDTQPLSNKSQTATRWPLWLVLCVFAITGLALGVRLMGKLSNKNRNSENAVSSANPNELLEKLRISCEKNLPREAAHLLLEYSAALWPKQPPLSLPELAGMVESGNSEIMQLEQALYRSNNSTWKGQPLLALLDNGFNKKPQKSAQSENHSVLKPLYPATPEGVTKATI